MRASRKLDMDLAEGMTLRPAMDKGITYLVAHLCTQAGMIMEDHADAALTMRAMASTEWPAALDALELAAHEIGVLVKAAKVIAEKG